MKYPKYPRISGAAAKEAVLSQTGAWSMTQILSDFGQTNQRQRHFNEQPIRELHGEVDSIQTSLKPSSNNGMLSLSFSSWKQGGDRRGMALLRPAAPNFIQQASGHRFKDDVNGFSSISAGIFLMPQTKMREIAQLSEFSVMFGIHRGLQLSFRRMCDQEEYMMSNCY